MIETISNSNPPTTNRVRVVIANGSQEPRILEAVTDAPPDEVQRAIDAGAAWFGIAFGESLRRARQRRAAELPAERAA